MRLVRVRVSAGLVRIRKGDGRARMGESRLGRRRVEMGMSGPSRVWPVLLLWATMERLAVAHPSAGKGALMLETCHVWPATLACGSRFVDKI